ncbi:hypothetical protein ACRBLZ_000466 [Campylobacter upsaliensis]|uniref:Uncharacterized protein n=1 Tax=Campylobacter upsaliensis TaxID=28080 RepID=A0A5L4SRA8_CAMUP|nr:hypothetical protein [Campylobacter upsaliensis]EAI8054040.1 hypothetical protein [Campylobacter upsaliensis]EAJ4502094.1 hypothetical protein [Campylobacter upsaliensis]EAJ5080197.1 hypothetical protein [Campylobacter upsaliensis]EAK0955149.1 hypothetical protein [Campylobacter upsaliensis]EAK2502547.1 hypothetical protein [Campylobacter upsaliensis]
MKIHEDKLKEKFIQRALEYNLHISKDMKFFDRSYEEIKNNQNSFENAIHFAFVMYENFLYDEKYLRKIKKLTNKALCED